MFLTECTRPLYINLFVATAHLDLVPVFKVKLSIFAGGLGLDCQTSQIPSCSPQVAGNLFVLFKYHLGEIVGICLRNRGKIVTKRSEQVFNLANGLVEKCRG